MAWQQGEKRLPFGEVISSDNWQEGRWYGNKEPEGAEYSSKNEMVVEVCQ